VQIGGRQVKIVESNKDSAMDWFAAWAAERINALGTSRKIIVPIPSSKTTLVSQPTFRTALIAQKIAALCKAATTFPSLRFFAERLNSREEGGSRDASELYKDLSLVATMPAGQLILVDDVLTGGGHLKAAAWTLEDAGGVVEQAVCCGRSLETQLEDPFEVAAETIDTARD
jgi:predicted amidophosphoribosyltransferase